MGHFVPMRLVMIGLAWTQCGLYTSFDLPIPPTLSVSLIVFVLNPKDSTLLTSCSCMSVEVHCQEILLFSGDRDD